MASSLLALLDDISTVLDDVAVLTKVATKKTAGVLGDDLALNAQQVTGVATDRELPVVFAVAKGSLVNKAILAPIALLLSAFAPWAVTPLLILGGLYLCFEGAEKVAHKLLHSKAEDDAEREKLTQAVRDPSIDLVALERDKIKGAIRTDFILSAEIIVISLGTVADAAWPMRVGVLVGISLLMTVGVYGLVAGIVKLDDGALALTQSSSSASRALGDRLLAATPKLMKGLSIAGTAAMFLVGGNILTHGVPPVHHFMESSLHGLSGISASIASQVFDALVGLTAGLLVLALFTLFQRVRARTPAK